MLNLIRVIWHLRERRLDVVGRDSKGRLRRVMFSWVSGDPLRVPDHWLTSVQKEIAFMDQAGPELRFPRK